MKKMLMLATILAFVTPVFAANAADGAKGPQMPRGPQGMVPPPPPQAFEGQEGMVPPPPPQPFEGQEGMVPPPPPQPLAGQQMGPEAQQGMKHPMAQKHEEMKARMEAHRAQMEAYKNKIDTNQEKIEQLVKEYKKAKPGSKQQTAAREEIGKLLGEIREGQLELRSKQVEEFGERLGNMAELLEKEKDN